MCLRIIVSRLEKVIYRLGLVLLTLITWMKRRGNAISERDLLREFESKADEPTQVGGRK